MILIDTLAYCLKSTNISLHHFSHSNKQNRAKFPFLALDPSYIIYLVRVSHIRSVLCSASTFTLRSTSGRRDVGVCAHRAPKKVLGNPRNSYEFLGIPKLSKGTRSRNKTCRCIQRSAGGGVSTLKDCPGIEPSAHPRNS